MTKKGICCTNCFKKIAKKSTGAARLWLNLCDLKMESDIFGTWDTKDENIRILEMLQFITTTDTLDRIFIKVHGHQEDGVGSFFCLGACDEE